jgi:dTDP-4-dehydrorhamnose 3,5-epimerase
VRIEKTPLEGCFVIYDTVFKDERGYFFESFNKKIFFEQTGFTGDFVQDNQSRSVKGVLRGLHFQKGDMAQAKLVRVLEGSVFDVAVDLRKDSMTYGKSFSIELTRDNQKQLFIPKGFAHGFLCLSESCVFFYKCDNYYDKAAELGIAYNDPDINIDWPITEEQLIVSEKDKNNLSFKEAATLL